MGKSGEILPANPREKRGGEAGKKKLLRISWIVLAAGAAGGSAYGLCQAWPHISAHINSIGFQGNIDRLREFILSFGFWAPFISACLMVTQSVVLFLPAFPLFVVNALSFGAYWGMLLSWSSAVLGSLVCFAIAKKLGRPVVQRLVNRIHLEAADLALRKYEKFVILFFGFVPVISFDVISYASGLTLLPFWGFFPLVLLAQIPSALFYSILVDKIDRGTLDAYWAVGGVLFLALGVSTLAARDYLTRRWREKGARVPEKEP
jgi:uncharacterized membrane protein YdjX (TVP38/TMEM64 family)